LRLRSEDHELAGNGRREKEGKRRKEGDSVDAAVDLVDFLYLYNPYDPLATYRQSEFNSNPRNSEMDFHGNNSSGSCCQSWWKMEGVAIDLPSYFTTRIQTVEKPFDVA